MEGIWVGKISKKYYIFVKSSDSVQKELQYVYLAKLKWFCTFDLYKGLTKF